MSDFLARVRNVTTGRTAPDHGEAPEPHVPPLLMDPPAAPAVEHTQVLIRKPPKPEPAAAVQTPANADLLGIAPAIRRVAELTAHAATKLPVTIGILGHAGTGKSFALRRMLDDIAAFAAGASRTASSPFVRHAVIARVDAAAPGEPATRIAAALFEALQNPAPDGRTYGALAEAASDAATDPAEAARHARERLVDARRRLDSEREALQDLNGRRLRIADSVLYEASGSKIDAHARAKRNSIESRLRSFGFISGDPVATYKDLVRDVSDKGGATGRFRATFRALWGFRGQTKLIVLAIIFFAIAWGIGEAQASRETWLGWLRGYDSLKTPTAWIESHISWLSIAKQSAIWAGVLALVWNFIRAARFLMPIFRGVSLYRDDVEARHRDLDTLIANQTRRVDDLAAEIDPLTARAAEAERRAAAAAESQQKVTTSPFATGTSHHASTFIGALAQAAGAHAVDAPERIVVAIDNLDALPDAGAASFMACAQELLAHPAYVTVMTGPDAGTNGLSRFVDIPVRLSALADSNRLGGFVRDMLGTGAPQVSPDSAVDATRSAFDQQMPRAEAELLEKLAPIAASGPRDVKRFVNAYRLARSSTDNFGALAVALALRSGAVDGERTAMTLALENAADHEAFAVRGADRINFALDAAADAQGSRVTAAQLREARALAAQWSF